MRTCLYVNKISTSSSGSYNLAVWHAMYEVTLHLLQVVEKLPKLPAKYTDVHICTCKLISLTQFMSPGDEHLLLKSVMKNAGKS